jgi:uncharacterized protein YaeQ
VVALTTAVATEPGSSPNSWTASVLISDTTRCGPHCSSTWDITVSDLRRVGGQYRVAACEPSQFQPVHDRASGVVLRAGENAVLDPAPQSVIADTEVSGGMLYSNLRHIGHSTTAYAEGGATAVGSSLMALGATMHTFAVQLADVDRGVYEELALRVARHPSETEAFMITRVLAYCLEYEEGIVFSEGISSADEPAVLVRDLTGRLTAWIEVGAPDADRLHYGSKLADRTAVYTHRDPDKVMAPWAGKRIHEAESITLHSFDPGFVDSAVAALERRNTMTVSVTERELYLDINGTSVSTAIHDRPLGV